MSDLGKWFKAQFQEVSSDKEAQDLIRDHEPKEFLVPEELYTVTTYVPVPEQNALVEIGYGFETSEELADFVERAAPAWGYVAITKLKEEEDE